MIRERSSLAQQLRREAIVPVLVAPMFLVSGPELVLACCRAGLMGSLPTQNARTIEQLDEWFETIGAQVSCWTHKRRGSRSLRPSASISLAPLKAP